MPQMAPIWWSTLISMFIMTYITVMILMYFFKIYNLKKILKKDDKNQSTINWKW